jgi:hypothetical protein
LCLTTDKIIDNCFFRYFDLDYFNPDIDGCVKDELCQLLNVTRSDGNIQVICSDPSITGIISNKK